MMKKEIGLKQSFLEMLDIRNCFDHACCHLLNDCLKEDLRRDYEII